MAQHEYGYSSLTFDESTGIVHGYAATEPDYNVQVYYYSAVDAVIYEVTDGGLTFLVGTHNINYGYASVDTQVEAEAATDYKLVSKHWVRAEYYEPEPEYYPERYRYVDYYGFYFLSGDGYWRMFDFFGTGPIKYLESNNVELGETYDSAKVGVPHHLYLRSDTIGTGQCGQAVRTLSFYVVDVNNRKTGRTLLKEAFPNGPYTDSCSGERVGDATVTPVATNSQGNFRDVVRTGCPSEGGTCGFTSYPGYMQWVPRTATGGYGTPVNLAVFHRDARYTRIGINGRYTEYPPDAQFFP